MLQKYRSNWRKMVSYNSKTNDVIWDRLL